MQFFQLLCLMFSLQTILSYVIIGANRKEIYLWSRKMTTVRADRTQSKKGTLSDCEKDPRKYKGPVTSVTLKHKIVLRLCFCFPFVCSGQIELTPEFSLQRTILICLYASMSKQNQTCFRLCGLSVTCCLSLWL